MDNHRLVFHERPVPLIVTPGAPRLRVGARPAEHTPEHFQGGVDPVILVDRSRSITLDARDEQDNQDTLAPALESRSSATGPCLPFRHPLDQYRSSAAGDANGRAVWR